MPDLLREALVALLVALSVLVLALLAMQGLLDLALLLIRISRSG